MNLHRLVELNTYGWFKRKKEKICIEKGLGVREEGVDNNEKRSSAESEDCRIVYQWKKRRGFAANDQIISVKVRHGRIR